MAVTKTKRTQRYETERFVVVVEDEGARQAVSLFARDEWIKGDDANGIAIGDLAACADLAEVLTEACKR